MLGVGSSAFGVSKLVIFYFFKPKHCLMYFAEPQWSWIRKESTLQGTGENIT